MLKIGVQLPSQVGEAGEYLADARALEAAGVDSIWMDHRAGQDPWMLLAGIAAVTGRVRLAITIHRADARAPEVLSQRVTTLQRLSRARAIVRIAEGPEPPRESDVAVDEVIDVVRRAGSLCVALEAADEPGYRRVARWADGFVHPGATPAASKAAFRRVLELRQRERATAQLEFWTDVAVPDARDRWKEMLRACEDAGATGAIVPFGPGLLDILRRPDEEDDRSDLLVAQG
jgi:alkanesulfonate monooxygenase SsuD/methylene tetrahydromethanopterin reductase-like flavin-dependent oxidoreductase (luciferase family)